MQRGWHGVRLLAFALLLAGGAGCRDLLGIHELPPTRDAEVEDGGPEADAASLVSWRVEITGNGSGGVKVGPSGGGGVLADCPPFPCAGSIASGGQLEVIPLPMPGSHFAGITPRADFFNGLDARVTVSADTTIQVRFLAIEHNLVFVTEDVPLVLGSAEAYDRECQRHAGLAGLPPIAFVAWLPSATQSAAQRIGAARGFVRMDGRAVADRLTDAYHYNSIALDVQARPVLARLVATASFQDGQPLDSCRGFTVSASSEFIHVGDANQGGQYWTDFSAVDCTRPRPIYCVMTSFTTPYTPPPSAGKLVFLSRDKFSAATGIASAHAICEREKPAARAGSTFRALLATTTQPAAAFLAAAATYVRPDGQIVGTGSELALGSAASGIWQHGDGAAAVGSAAVLTGAAGAPQTIGQTDSTCADWSSSSNAGNARLGFSHKPLEWWLWSSSSCSSLQAPVYCVEQ